MEDCIFCKIAAHKLPSNTVYENGRILAFLDINPASRGHTLVIPKEHYENLFDMPEDILKEVIVASKKIGKAQKEALHAKAVNLVNSSGKEAGQVVFHFHMHVIPRYGDDTHQIKWTPSPESRENLEKISSSLKEKMDND